MHGKSQEVFGAGLQACGIGPNTYGLEITLFVVVCSTSLLRRRLECFSILLSRLAVVHEDCWSAHHCAWNGNVATLKGLSSAALDGCDIKRIDQRGFIARQLFQQRNDRTEMPQKVFENLLSSVQAAQVGKIGTDNANEDEDTEDFSDTMEGLSLDEIG
jgi:hypothetical protein